MNALAKLVDAALSERMERHHYLAKGKGLFAQSDDDRTWRALWVTYFGRKGRPLCVQPNVAIFCPEASKIVKTGLGELHGRKAGRAISRIGSPLVTTPLYHLARTLCGLDRLPFSYHAAGDDDVAAVSSRICDDFKTVEPHFLPGTLSVCELFDRIVANPSDSGTGASMYAIALAYLLDPKLSASEIDDLTRLWPCQMTTEFAVYMKHRIASEK